MMKLKKKQEIWVRWMVYGLFGLVYLWLASCVPYTHDDWDWGISNGITQLLTANINSRYVGNFFVVVMTRSQLLKVLLMGASCVLVPYGIARILAQDRKERLWYFLTANLLILTMGYENWRETYAWVSGFANYVISTVFLLWNLRKLLREMDGAEPEGSVGKAALWGVSTLMGQLFLENLAIYMVMLVSFVCLVCRKKHHRISKAVLAMGLGAVLGLGIMFSSSIYGALWQTGSTLGGLRLLSLRAESSLMENIKGLVLQTAGLVRRGGEKQCFLSCAVLFLLAKGLWQKPGLKGKYLLAAVNLAIGVYFCAAAVFQISYTDGNLLMALVGAAANFLYFGVVTLEVFLVFWKEKEMLCRAALLWLSVIAYLAPLIFTTVYGPRLYYISNTFTILLIGLLLRHTGVAGGKKTALLKVVTAAGICLLFAHYGVIYHAIDRCNDQRLALMDQAVAQGQQEVVLPGYPYEEYLWMPDPISQEREGYYKAFYGLPEEMELRFE